MTNAQATFISAAIILAGAVIAIAVGIEAMAVRPGQVQAAPIPGIVAAIAGGGLAKKALTQMKKDETRGG